MEAESHVRRDPDDLSAYHRLAVASMRVQRETGQDDYYERAEEALRKAAKLAPEDYVTRKLLAWVLAGSHQFDEAVEMARTCSREQPTDYWNYGIIADALTETGDYDNAVAAVQTMVDLRPGSMSYARAAHQRRLHGQSKGALELLELALDATGPAESEALAWLRTQMADIAFEQGDLEQAQQQCAVALQLVPRYHLALAGQARLLAARGDLSGAADVYRQALARVQRPDWMAALGDVMLAMGNRAEAEEQYREAERYLTQRLDDPKADAGHALAELLADRGRQPERALALAQREIEGAKDIRAWDTYAWALYQVGRYEEAWNASRKALRLGTQDSKLLFHAGMIALRRRGLHEQEGVRLLRKALALNPAWHPIDAPQARRTLQRAEGSGS